MRLHPFYFFGLAFAAIGQAIPAAPIPGLFNTGLDPEGRLIAESAIADAHYQLVESPDADFAGPDAVTLNSGFPVGPWIEEGPDSRWVAPQADQGAGNAPGIYVYRTIVDLTSFDPSSIRITGRWSTDDAGLDILVNGTSTGIGSNGFGGWTDFELTEGFVAGANLLDFRVENGGAAANPTGIRVEMQGEGEFQTQARIPDLFSTGIGPDGTLLGPSGETDAHYALVESADPDSPGPEAVTLNPGFPVGPWLAEGEDSEFPDSRWIAPRAAQNLGSNSGVYRYRTTFHLDGFDLATVRIVGRWGTDDGSLEVLLNGEDLFIASNGFVDWADFEITEGFVPGENTLEFAVENGGAARNPTGLRVDIVEATGELSGGSPPSIVTRPQSRRVVVGDTVTLNVSAGGSPPLSYQWKRDGENVVNGNVRTLTLESIGAAEAGDYTVTVRNGAGEATSEPATVTVLLPIPGLSATGIGGDGRVLDDGAVDPHYRLFDNADSDSDAAIVHDSQVFPIVEGPWLANSEASKWIAPLEDTGAAAGGDYTYRIVFDLTGLDPSSVLLRGRWATDNAGLDIRVNGASTGRRNDAQFANFTNFRIEDAPFLSGENTLDFVINNAGAGPTALRVDSLSGGGEPTAVENRAPRFVVEPTGVEAFRGEDVRLISLADGTAPLTYAWKRNGETVGDTPDLVLDAIQFDQAGEYVIEVSNAEGTATSPAVTVSVLEPIPGLFNTGLNDAGEPLEDREPDPHYQLLSDPNEEGLETLTLDSTVFPIVAGPWVPNQEGSKWIGVQEDNNGPPGFYVYRLTFDLSAFDPENVFVEGDWAADDRGDPLVLNGVTLDLPDAANFTALTHFRIEDGFLRGLNTLDFPVENGGADANPTGLKVENLRGGGPTEDPNLIGPSTSPFGQLESSQAITVTATLRNSGRTEPLAITGVRIVGEDADLFQLGEVPAQLPPNASVLIEITVNPMRAKGNFAAALELTTNDPSTPVQLFDISAFVPVSPNLVAHYKLDETDGAALIDASGFGRNGSYNATQGTLTLGQDTLAAGTSTAFTGGAFAEAGPDVLPVFGDSFTISLWHTPGATEGAASIVSRGDGQGNPFALVAAGSTLFWFSAGGDPAVTLENALTLGERHHLAVVVSNNTASIYINGLLAGSGPTESYEDNARNTLQFGAANGILGINGRLDDIQIYKVALEPEVVSSLFANPGSLAGAEDGDPEPQPTLLLLRIAADGDGLRLSWPNTAVDYTLSHSSDLRSWTALPTAPSDDGAQFTVMESIGAGARYYRLER